MSTKFPKNFLIQTFIFVGSIALISLISETRQTANSNSIAQQIASVENPSPNLLKPPKLKTPPSPPATPPPHPHHPPPPPPHPPPTHPPPPPPPPPPPHHPHPPPPETRQPGVLKHGEG